MSLWHCEITRLDGTIKAYVGIQNDYTGEVRYQLRDIHDKKGYWIVADGQHVDVSEQYKAFLKHEETVAAALKLYNDNQWIGRGYR